MPTIYDIPEEIIEMILSQNISIRDFLNFSTTCKYFRNMIEEGNIFWQRKFFERWPNLKTVCETAMCENYINFKELLQKRINCKNILLDCLKEMSIKNCSCTATLGPNLRDSDDEKEEEEEEENERRPKVYNQADNVYIDEEELCSIIHSNDIIRSLQYHFILDETMNLIKYDKCKYKTDEYYNLTNIYYAGKLLPYLKHYHLRNHVWPEFISRPAEQQLLEEAVVFVAQWFQPEKDISYSYVKTQLDIITQRVMKNFKIQRPGHPIFSESSKQLSFWTCNNIDEDQWNYNDSKQILDIICDVLIMLGFYGEAAVEDLFIMNIFLINYILEEKFGHSILLAIIFHSIARRFGIRCDVIYLADADSSNFYLRWKPKRDININLDDEQYFYINVWDMYIFKSYSRFQNLEQNEAPLETLNMYEKINPVELIEYITNSIIKRRPYNAFRNDLEMRWLLELQQLVKPDEDKKIKITEYYVKQTFGLSGTTTLFKEFVDKYKLKRQKINNMIREFKEMEKNEETIHKYIEKYLPKVNMIKTDYLIGMIVILDNETIGVINGKIFTKNSCIYTLLAENNKFLIGTKDDLCAVDSPKAIKHSEIGRFFYEFKGTHYVPNDMLASVYPLDILYL